VQIRGMENTVGYLACPAPVWSILGAALGGLLIGFTLARRRR
jgi:hypothetical protein